MTRPHGTRVWGWWLAPLLFAAGMLVPWPGPFVERWYSADAYLFLQFRITALSNATAVALMDVGLAALAGWLLWRVVAMVRQARATGWLGALWTIARRVLRVAGVLALVFFFAWGLNYRRVPLEVTLGGDPSAPLSSEVLVASVRRAAEGANALRTDATRAPHDYDSLAALLAPRFGAALAALDLPRLARPGRPKVSILLTPFFTAAGITGMVNPIALESIVHPELLPFERPMVLAHEWAHLAGYADEADASAIGWAACVGGGAPLAYSAHMYFMLEAAGQLPRGEWARIRASLAPGVVEDFAALARRLTRQQPVVRDTAFRVYDQYLRSNQVDDGVRSYGRAIRVLLTPAMQSLQR